MNPSWPKRIDGGWAERSPPNAHKKGPLRKPNPTTFWPSDAHSRETGSVPSDSRVRHFDLSSVKGVLAIVPFAKLVRHPLESPNLSTCPSGVLSEILVPLRKVVIDRLLCRFDRRVIAVMDYRS